MDIYTINLTALLGLCGALFYMQKSQSQSQAAATKPTDKNSKTQKQTPPSSSQWPFLAVYTLVMASDWLQGPFLYSLYHDEHGLAPSLISTLFTTGFLSGAASGSVIGSLADRHGRKAACLFFCGAYGLSCVLTTLGATPLLFAGRILGGLGTSLLFSVFESWMVTDFHAKRKGLGGDLSRTFGLMSTLNSVVAILSGVGSEWLVSASGTRKAPFAASVVLLIAAAGIIATQWVST